MMNRWYDKLESKSLKVFGDIFENDGSLKSQINPKHIEMLFLQCSEEKRSVVALMWQVPVTVLTGEAFLLSIALGNGIENQFRIIALVVGLALCVCTYFSFNRLAVVERYLAHCMNVLGNSIFGECLYGEAYCKNRNIVIKKERNRGYGSFIIQNEFFVHFQIKHVWQLFIILLFIIELYCLIVFSRR
mmetsp:Transcript_66918/g.131746  ORF Transcript_66918/g.131746 Transcript_66918/m.131746 type:complete len:188 (-) Transcript_66918:92-655(-)